MTKNLPESHSAQTQKQMLQESIVITKCLTPGCTGFYTDSISEYFLIKCLDPKHNVDEVGHQPTPGAEAVLQKTTATQPAKLGSVIKWDIQQS